MKKIFLVFLIAALSTTILINCKKENKGTPPELPPYESMLIDFSNFVSLKKSSNQPSGVKGTDDSSWEFASGISNVWASLLSKTLMVPVASYESAVGQTAEYLSLNNWQWKFTFNAGNADYKARLTSITGTNQITWKMYLTKEGSGGFTDFLWIEGTSKADGTGGQWTFSESPSSNVKLLRIDWSRNGTTMGVIKYTYLKNDSFKDSYIEYGSLTGSSLDKYYKISYTNIQGTYVADIEWNKSSKNGRVKCLNYVGDDLWYCWDGNKINIICL